MVARSDVEVLGDRLITLENMMPGIQLQSQQRDQSTSAVEARISVIESRIQAITEHAADTSTMEAIIDAKIRTAIQMSDVKSRISFSKPILESKAISEVGKLTDAKSYRPWNRKAKNAIDQIRPTGRKVMEMLESITEEMITNASARDQKNTIKDTIMDVYLARFAAKFPDLEKSGGSKQGSLVDPGGEIRR